MAEERAYGGKYDPPVGWAQPDWAQEFERWNQSLGTHAGWNLLHAARAFLAGQYSVALRAPSHPGAQGKDALREAVAEVLAAAVFKDGHCIAYAGDDYVWALERLHRSLAASASDAGGKRPVRCSRCGGQDIMLCDCSLPATSTQGHGAGGADADA